MAQHPLAQRTVTQDVIRDDQKAEQYQVGASLASGLAGLSFNAAEKADVAKMNNFSADAKTKMMDAQSDWRVQNQDNPLDPQAHDKLNDDFDKILNPYADQLSLMSKGTWQQHSVALKQAFKDDNYNWGVKKSISNAEVSMNDSMKKNNALAVQFGNSLDFENAKKNLVDAQNGINAFTKGLGANDERIKITKNFQSDYMFSFLYGVAQTDPKKAREMLNDESFQKDLANGNPEYVQKTRKMIDGMQMVHQENQTANLISNRTKTLMDVATGNSTLIDTVAQIGKVAKDDPSLAEALQKVADSGGHLDIDRKDEAFSNVVEKVFSADDKKSASDYLVNALKDRNISNDKLAILVEAASKQSLPTMKGGQFSVDPQQEAISAGIKSISNFSKSTGINDPQVYADYLGQTNKGYSPKDAFKFATKNAIVRKYPQTSTMDEPPNMVITPDSNIKVVFPKETKVYPNRIYDSTSKSFKMNPETHPEAKKK